MWELEQHKHHRKQQQQQNNKINIEYKPLYKAMYGRKSVKKAVWVLNNSNTRQKIL